MPARPSLPALKPAAHYHFLAETLKTLEGSVRHGLQGGNFIPAEWHEVALRAPAPEKTHITLRLDADVLRFFQLLGRGYRTDMNRVLRAFMHARLAGVLKGPEDQDHGPTPAERYAMLAHGLLEKMRRTNLRKAAGLDTRPEELEEDRDWRELDRLADEIGLPQADRLRRREGAG
jgi:hypothetical protein